MKCMNCGCVLTDKSTDFTLKVMLCGQCAVGVSKLKDRIRSEVETLLASIDDTLRFGLASGERIPSKSEGASRQQVLEFIVKLDTQCRNTSKTTTSSKSTKPSAITVAGNGSSPKPSAPD